MQNPKQEFLFQSLLIQNVSTNWYQTEIRKVLDAIATIEGGEHISKDTGSIYYRLQGQLFYLMGKAFFERALLTKLKQEIKDC